MGVPERLVEEQRAVEAEIRRAFRGVTREGGVSWSEADVVDDYGTDEERAAARARDKESCWEELVEDGAIHLGSTRFCFLDAIGFRYYIAPAMILLARGADDYVCQLTFRVDGPHGEAQVGLLNVEQRGVVARFLRFMMKVEEGRGDLDQVRKWGEVLEMYWGQREV